MNSNQINPEFIGEENRKRNTSIRKKENRNKEIRQNKKNHPKK